MATTPAGGLDAAQLRHSIFDKGAATRVDLAGLLALGREAGDDPAFIALLADVAADVMTGEVDPLGYVSEADADWLIAQLGDGDGLTPPELAIEMCAGIQGSKLTIVKDCGHLSTIERPDDVNAAMLQWLNA